MKKLSNILRIICVVILVLQLPLAWLPSSVITSIAPTNLAENGYMNSFIVSFRELSVTLLSTMILAMIISIALGYISVLSMRLGRGFQNVLTAVESIPAILIVLFCYAPIANYLAQHSNAAAMKMSIIVFVLSATVTTLPEAVRSITIPLTDLYNRKYSLSFRSYGFTKSRILIVLMNTDLIRNTLKRVAASILLKTLVLDCSFGFIIQVGFGSYGTPAHLSPGALIAANRNAVLADGNPVLFWLPSILLIAISIAFLLMLNDTKEENE